MRLITGIEKKDWADFVHKHPNGNIFQTPEIFDAYKQIKSFSPICLAAANENDELVGILVAIVHREFSNFLGNFTSRSIVTGGPLVKEDHPDIIDYLLKEYKSVLKPDVIYSQFRNIWQWDIEVKDIFSKNGFIYEDHLDILIDLNNSEDQIWDNFSRDRKKSVRKGLSLLKSEIIDPDKNFEDIYDLLKKVYTRIHLPLPSREFFKNAIYHLCKEDELIAFGAFRDFNLVGVRLVLCYKEMIYDWYAGADDDYLEFRPNDVLPWIIMKWGIGNRYSIFDFGGAGKPDVPYGVRDFKLKFGGQLVNFGRFEMIHKPYMFKLGKFALNIFKKVHGLFRQ